MSSYTSGIIDIGLVVSNTERAIAFYRDVLGFEHVSSFEVPADMGFESGLTNMRPFKAEVLHLPGTDPATKIKLIQFSDAVMCCDTSYIHTVRGVRYLTLRVADIDAALAKAEAAGAHPIARGPTEMPPELRKGIWLAVLRDPDGNMIELVGPRQGQSASQSDG